MTWIFLSVVGFLWQHCNFTTDLGSLMCKISVILFSVILHIRLPRSVHIQWKLKMNTYLNFEIIFQLKIIWVETAYFEAIFLNTKIEDEINVNVFFLWNPVLLEIHAFKQCNKIFLFVLKWPRFFVQFSTQYLPSFHFNSDHFQKMPTSASRKKAIISNCSIWFLSLSNRVLYQIQGSLFYLKTFRRTKMQFERAKVLLLQGCLHSCKLHFSHKWNTYIIL